MREHNFRRNADGMRVLRGTLKLFVGLTLKISPRKTRTKPIEILRSPFSTI